MEKRNIIVIGASAGGFEAIKQLVARLPADVDASIFIVWHMAADVRGVLPMVLTKIGKIPAAHAVDKEPIRAGRIYVAPPDHHLLIEKEGIRITRGPKENRFRPAVDPLFRSAAYTYGARVIGVILSGALDDGTAGLWTIKEHGGIAVVQHPADAEVPSMPEHALQAVEVDYSVPVAEIPQLLLSLIGQPVAASPSIDNKERKRLAMEIHIAQDDDADKRELLRQGHLTIYTCPECHGVLTALKEGGRVRYRCHTGHAFSADSLLAALTENIEDGLWNTIRSIDESVMLLNHLGDHFAERNEPKLAAAYFRKAKEATERAQLVRNAAMHHERLSGDSIKDESGAISGGSA